VKILPALQTLSELESSIAKLYEYYRDILAENPKARLLFFRMAREEHNHVRIVAYQRRLVRANFRLFGDIDLDLTEVERTTIEVQALTAQPFPPSVDEAVGAALRIETNAAESHYRNALASSDEEIAAFLDNLARGDKEHLARLTAFAQEQGLEEAVRTPTRR
jgi:rubrerythrin